MASYVPAELTKSLALGVNPSIQENVLKKLLYFLY